MKIRKVPGAIYYTSKDGPAQLAYGWSITDACLGWNDSLSILGIVGAAGCTERMLWKETSWSGLCTFI